MIKLIAIDTDGTLLNSRGQIQAIAKACFVGTSVAMGNGNDLVKQAADYVTSSNDEDGIAQALEKFVF